MSTTRHHVTLLPGDGIGREIAGAALRVIEEADISNAWERVETTSEVHQTYGMALPGDVVNPRSEGQGPRRRGRSGPRSAPDSASRTPSFDNRSMLVVSVHNPLRKLFRRTVNHILHLVAKLLHHLDDLCIAEKVA